MSRDWLSTLIPASFNGVPFWTKDDSAETGRRIHIAVFPGADDPFLEDLGRNTRIVTISGYFASDVADVGMAALEAACETAGPGALSLPAQGLVQARCRRVKRRRDRDRMGYFAFEADFVREGLSSGAAPSLALANQASIASQGLGSSGSGFLNAGMQL